MKTKYTSEDILKMAVGLISSDLDADMDSDGKITSSDARLRLRAETGADPGSSSTLTATDILDKLIENTDSFSYDFNVDPLYQHYNRLYSDAARRDASDVMGLAASLTGGYGNSYGLTKAAEVKNDYARLLSEKAGELEDKAYDRHLDGIKAQYEIFDALRQLDADSMKEEKESFEKALKSAQLGDLTLLEGLGFDTTELKKKTDEERAAFFAKYKDYSLLKELGIDTVRLEKEELSELARLFAAYGDYTLLEALGADTSAQKALDELDRSLKAARLK